MKKNVHKFIYEVVCCYKGYRFIPHSHSALCFYDLNLARCYLMSMVSHGLTGYYIRKVKYCEVIHG